MFFRFARRPKTTALGALAAAAAAAALALGPTAPAGFAVADEPQCVLKSTGFNGVYCLWEDEPAGPSQSPSPRPGPPSAPPSTDH